MDISFEKIEPWNGAQDTGRDVRLKWERNFSKVASALTELADEDKELNELIESILEELKKFLRKDREDQTNFLLKLLGGIITNNIESEGFTTGALGAGFTLKIDENGRSYLEVDNALFRRSATFIELLIQSLRHVGGQIMLTPASMHCVRVEELEDCYRCYFEATDGDRTIANEFVVGDQARSQTFNIKEGAHENVTNTYYWRLVVGVGDDYIDLSKTDCDAGSGIPAAGDDIVQLGNRTDETRQAAIIQSSYGNDAPYFKLYRGIDSYDLTGKEFVTFSRSEVMVIADSIRLSTGETVKDYIDGALANLDFGGGDNLLINSKLDNTEGWTMDELVAIEEFDGYECLHLTYSNRGLETTTQENARFIPLEGTITNSIDVYTTRECDIYIGFTASSGGTIHVTELNKWVRVSSTQTLDGTTPYAFVVRGGSGVYESGVYVKEAKCEKGTEATPWKPCIYDIDVVNRKVDTQFTVLKGEIKAEVSSTVSSLGSAGDNLVKEGEYNISPGYSNPGFIELYKSLVPGDTYTAVLSGELPDGHRFQLCDSGQWEVQGEFEPAQGSRIYVLRFTYEPNSQTQEHDKLYLRVEPEDGYTWDLDWICIYEGNVIPPYVFVPAPQEQESGSLDIGVRNLLLNSKLDNLEGWSVNYAASIVEFDGYTCLKAKGSYYGIYTKPTTGNARLIPTEGVITNSIDVYVTAECDIAFGREGISSNIVHVSEVNKWVRVSNTQELDGQKKSYVIYVTGNTATAYFKDAKCEKGTVATGWTPAPEDLKGFDGRNLVVRGKYNLKGVTDYKVRNVYLSQDLTVGKSYTAVLSGNVGGSQQLGLWNSTGIGKQGMFTKKSGRIYMLTFTFSKSSGANNNTLQVYNTPQETCADYPADVDWLCIYETRSDIPQVFVPAPEDDCTLTAWGGHYGAEKSEVALGDHAAQTQTGRGFHLWRLDIQTMRLAAVGSYDVYSTTGDAKTQFVTALNGIGSGYLAIVTSCDAITIDTAIQTALNGFGADAPLMDQSRMSFVLVGKQGIGAGNGVMKLSAVEAVSVSVRVVEGVCRDFFQGGGLAEWKVETRTWIKNNEDTINLHAEELTKVEGRVSKAESDITQNAHEIGLRVKDEDFNGNEIVGRINLTSTTATIEAERINLVGKVSIGMFDKTIIENGKIKANLIDTDSLVATNLAATVGTIGGFTIEKGRLYWKGYDYFGNDSRSLYLGVSNTATDGIVDIKFGTSTTGRFGVKSVGSNAGGASIYASTGSLTYPGTGMTYAGFFVGPVEVRDTGSGISSDICASKEFRYITGRNSNGTYNYQKGVNWGNGMPDNPDLDSIRLIVRGGIIVGYTGE